MKRFIQTRYFHGRQIRMCLGFCRRYLVLALCFLALNFFERETIAQENSTVKFSAETKKAETDATLFPVPDFGGNLWSRSYLTGDWGGLRTRLANNGVQFEL